MPIPVTRHVHFDEQIVGPLTPSPSVFSSALPSPRAYSSPMHYHPSMQHVPASTTPHTIRLHPALTAPGAAALRFAFNKPYGSMMEKRDPKEAGVLNAALGEPATCPTQRTMIIANPNNSSWDIEITARDGRAVTVEEVLWAVYRSLRMTAPAVHYEELPDDRERETVAAAFTRRWSSLQDPAACQLEHMKGLKRVDYLGPAVNFVGLKWFAPDVYHLLVA